MTKITFTTENGKTYMTYVRGQGQEAINKAIQKLFGKSAQFQEEYDFVDKKWTQTGYISYPNKITNLSLQRLTLSIQ